MAHMKKSTVQEDGTVIHHGICGHDFPGTGKRGRPFRTCPKCRAKEATEAKPKRASHKKAKKSAEALV